MKTKIKINKNQIPFQPSLHPQSVMRIRDEINQTEFKSMDFLASAIKVPVILLKGVGKFCECGCGKKIQGRWIKRKSKNGKPYSYFQKPKENERFASKACLNRIYNKKRDPLKSSRLHCELKLNVISDKIPYRELLVYLGERQRITIKITAEQKQLWETLEKISRYRHVSKSEKQMIEVISS